MLIVIKSVLLAFTVLCVCVDFTVGHGRMIEPAARNTMWRFKYKNPRNYNDMGLNCGGFPNQFEQQGGRCGVCGDPFQGPRDHEAGGKYARGVIARQYRVGSFINVTVELTSNHKGYMEFRLCPVNNPRMKVTQNCLDQNLLNIIGHGTRYFISQNGASVFIELLVMLPPKLQCSQCVIQWKWVAGQSMGPDGFGGECMGCGNQEHFVNCADVAIGNKAVKPLPPLKGSAPRPKPAAPRVQNQGPAYNVIGSESGGYSSGYGAKAAPAPARQAYQPPAYVPPPRPKTTTTQSPWNNMDQNMMLQNFMSGGAFDTNALMMGTASPWGLPWQQQVQSAGQMQQAMPQQHSAYSSMMGMMPNLFRENMEWSTEAPRTHYVTPSPAHSHASGSDPSDYAGNEPGEYPENESPSSGASGGSGSSSYMQGFNDALRQMQQGLGLSGEWNPKASRAVSEITLSLNEKQKQGSNPSCPGRVCKATGSWKGQARLDTWCDTTCKAGQCPDHMCACTCPGAGIWGSAGPCRALDRQKGASMDNWCNLNCKSNNCPSDLCICM